MPVSVRPSTARARTGVYVVNSDDGQGAQSVPVVVNADPWVGAVRGGLGCLSVYAGLDVRGTAMVDGRCTGYAGARQLALGAGGSLRFGAATSGWCVDVSHAGTVAGTPVQLWSCNGSAAQVWRWDASGRLVNPHAGRCLDVRGHSGQVNTPLVLADCSRSAAQQWNLAGLVVARGWVGSGVAPAGVLCLTGATPAAGTPVTLAGCGAAGQVVVRNGATLRVAGLCVGFPANAVRTSPAQLQSCDGTARQAWQPGPHGRLRNAGSGLCLDVPHAAPKPGARLQAWSCNGSLAQTWGLP